MAFGKNKNILVKLLIALLGCITVVAVHHFGYEWYMTHFIPRSREVGLGFVMFYVRCVIIPVVFLSAFIKPKYSLLIFGLVIIFMLYSWYGSNPLRVLLMLLSCSVGYMLVIFLRSMRRKDSEHTNANDN